MIQTMGSYLRAATAGFVILAALVLAAPPHALGFEPPTGVDLDVSNILRDNLLTGDSAARLNLQHPELVSKFYTRMGFRPAWTKAGKALPEAQELQAALRASYAEGLDPGYYNLVDIEVGLRNLKDSVENSNILTPERIAWIEILLSDAYFAYASDLLTGRTKPRLVVEDARLKAITMELSGFLMRMLRVGWIKDSLESLSPPKPEYQRLKRALAFYRNAAAQGGWATLGTQMRRGDRGVGVTILRKRLAATGDLKDTSPANVKLFDSSVQSAVRRFQLRHAIEADGMVGPITLRTLNIPVENHINTIKMNMERLRWLPRTMSETFVLVNLADFTLKVVDNNTRRLNMRVIIGKNFMSTPSFSAKITSLVLNPYWNIPESITREEILPLLGNSTSYLKAQNIDVISGWGKDERIIDPDSINLASLSNPGSGMRLRQRPGGNNPLGQAKFLMPNRFNIYLHDTPADHLFERDVRAFSHGCIRLEKPIKLAAFAMRKSPRWNPTKIHAAIKTGSHYEINLPEPMNVIVLYQTAWADENSLVSFRNDIYGRDSELSGKMQESMRTPASEQLNNNAGY